MSELTNCKFCQHIYWDRQFQRGYCNKRKFSAITDVNSYWCAQNCGMFKLDERFAPKMTVLIKCIDCESYYKVKETAECKIRPVTIREPTKQRTCSRFKSKFIQKKHSSGEYININYNKTGDLHGVSTPGFIHIDHAVAEINKHTKKNKFASLEDSPYVVVSVGDTTWRSDEGPPSVEIKGNTHIDGDLTVVGEIKMNQNMEKRVKEKQEKINKIVDARKEYVNEWIKKFKELDSDVRYRYVLKYSWLRKEFIKYVLDNIGKNSRKGLKTALKYIMIHLSDDLVTYGKRGQRVDAHLLSGEEWNFVKKILAIISKYGISYANDRLKVEYSELTSKYDGLLYDDEKIICESCGTENEIVALYCNTCGKKL